MRFVKLWIGEAVEARSERVRRGAVLIDGARQGSQGFAGHVTVE